LYARRSEGGRPAAHRPTGPPITVTVTMDVYDALEAWQAQYSGQPPVGFMLRFTHEAVWTRVHYSTTACSVTVEDAWCMASHFDTVCSTSTGRLLVTAIQVDPSYEESATLRAAGARFVVPPPGWLVSLRDYVPNPGRAEFVAATMPWQRRCLNDVWFAVARDRIERIAVFSPATGDAFCPYPGADVFVWGAGAG
jgi:hypothetical protein